MENQPEQESTKAPDSWRDVTIFNLESLTPLQANELFDKAAEDSFDSVLRADALQQELRGLKRTITLAETAMDLLKHKLD